MMQCGAYFFLFLELVQVCLSFKIAVIMCRTAFKQLPEPVLVLGYPLIRIWNFH
jgi:hypothetical protein